MVETEEAIEWDRVFDVLHAGEEPVVSANAKSIIDFYFNKGQRMPPVTVCKPALKIRKLLAEHKERVQQESSSSTLKCSPRLEAFKQLHNRGENRKDLACLAQQVMAFT